MSDLVCVTNRRLAEGTLAERIARILALCPRAMILREKDLSEAAYEGLARSLLPLFSGRGTRLILHTHLAVARRLGVRAIHLPMAALCAGGASRDFFTHLGASCHSVAEARAAEARGATYLVAGHVYATDCKKGVPARGLSFLREVASAVRIPVYAIGGVTPARMPEIRMAGAAGGCAMGSLMRGDLWMRARQADGRRMDERLGDDRGTKDERREPAWH